MTVIQLAAPSKGVWSASVSPLAVPKGFASDITNMLVDLPGRLRMRGSLGTPRTLFASANAYTGVIVVGDFIAFSSTPQSAWLNVPTGSVNLIGDTAAQRLNGRSAQVDNYAYGPSVDTTVGLLRWSNAGGASPTTLTQSPKNAIDVCSHLGRLFVLGTNSSVQRHRVFWTDVGGSTADTAAEWTDDVSGLTNQLDAGIPDDAGVALASLGRQLVIFKQNSIWAAIGDSPATFTLRQVAANVGCLDKNSVVVADDLCFFMATDGTPMLYDGSSFERLPQLTDLFHPGSTAKCSATRLPNNYIMLAYDDGSNGDTFALLYLPERAWTFVDFPSAVLATGDSSHPVRLASNQRGIPVIADSTAARSLSALTAGVPNGGNGTERNLANTTDVNIDASVTYRRDMLGLPLAKVVLRRAAVDAALRSSGSPSWKLDLASINGAAISQLTYPGASSADPQRLVQDVNQEVEDARVTMTYSAPAATALSAADLYDVWLEYDSAQRR